MQDDSSQEPKQPEENAAQNSNVESGENPQAQTPEQPEQANQESKPEASPPEKFKPVRKSFKKPLIAAIVIIILLVAGGLTWKYAIKSKPTASTSTGTSSASTTTKSSSTSIKAPTKTNTVDMSKLPLGDGKVTTAGAKQGYVYSCTSNFKGGGAEHAGSWISGSTWDYNTKPTVNGNVTWSNAKFSATLSGSNRILSGNGLPVSTPTGVFPIQSGTTAYQYDRNPNSITAYNVSYTLPANPTVASKPTCTGLGPIGYMLNGVALFNALDASGRDAAAHEIQDKCQGHPQGAGIYHYHSMSSCIKNEDANNTLVGYALDGFGIYSDRNANGKQYSTADLDACHGITSPIMWDGKMVNMYHYVLTEDYPYSIGCFRGTPLTQHQQTQQAPSQRPAPQSRP